MKGLKATVAATALLAASAGIAAAGQNSASSDWNNSWRWSETESLLNLERARLIEQKEEGGFGFEVNNNYQGADFSSQQAISIGNQTIQECDVGAGGFCKSTQDSSGSQGAGNQESATGGQNSQAADDALNLQ